MSELNALDRLTFVMDCTGITPEDIIFGRYSQEAIDKFFDGIGVYFLPNCKIVCYAIWDEDRGKYLPLLTSSSELQQRAKLMLDKIKAEL